MIPLVKPAIFSEQDLFLAELVRHPEYHTEGHFAYLCETWLENHFSGSRVFTVSSCTHALEAAFMLLDLPAGAEVIMPSWNFVSAGNAAVRSGLIPVWADVDDEGNICPDEVARLITPQTKALLIMHYLGIPAQIDRLMILARENNLLVIEDAAYGLFSEWEGKPLGSFGHLGCVSFDHTKPLHAGRGGALVINDVRFRMSAERILDMGTDKAAFLRGESDVYQWQCQGSKFRMPETSAALLYAGLLNYSYVRHDLESVLQRYRSEIDPPIFGVAGAYALARSEKERNEEVVRLQNSGIYSTFHYQPLHLSHYGKIVGVNRTSLHKTEAMSRRIFRVPLFSGMTPGETHQVIKELNRANR